MIQTIILLATTLVAAVGLADAAVVAVVAEPKFLDGILAALAGAGGIVSAIVIVAEVVLRMVPTAKPLSVLIPVQYVVIGLIKILEFVKDLVVKLIEVANKVKPAVLPVAEKKK